MIYRNRNKVLFIPWVALAVSIAFGFATNSGDGSMLSYIPHAWNILSCVLLIGVAVGGFTVMIFLKHD